MLTFEILILCHCAIPYWTALCCTIQYTFRVLLSIINYDHYVIATGKKTKRIKRTFIDLNQIDRNVIKTHITYFNAFHLFGKQLSFISKIFLANCHQFVPATSLLQLYQHSITLITHFINGKTFGRRRCIVLIKK